MPVTVEDLDRAIRAAFPVSHLKIEDQSSGCGTSYAILLVSEVRIRVIMEHCATHGQCETGYRSLKGRIPSQGID